MFSTWYVNLLTNWKWYWLVLAFYLIYNSSCTVQLTVRMKLNLLWRLVLCNCNICRMQWTYDVPVFFIMFLVEKKGSCKDCLPCSKEKRKKNYRNVIQKQIDYIAVIFITLKSYFGKEGIGERERETQNLAFAGSPHKWLQRPWWPGLSKQKLRTWSSFEVSHAGAGARAPGPSSAAFLSALRRSWIRSGEAGTVTGQLFNSLCHNADLCFHNFKNT